MYNIRPVRLDGRDFRGKICKKKTAKHGFRPTDSVPIVANNVIIKIKKGKRARAGVNVVAAAATAAASVRRARNSVQKLRVTTTTYAVRAPPSCPFFIANIFRFRFLTMFFRHF